MIARIASKNHANGAHNPRAQFRREMDVDAICKMAAVAGQLSVMDCAGVADGSAAALFLGIPLYLARREPNGARRFGSMR